MGEANNSDKDRLETLEERLEKLRKREKELTDKEGLYFEKNCWNFLK